MFEFHIGNDGGRLVASVPYASYTSETAKDGVAIGIQKWVCQEVSFVLFLFFVIVAFVFRDRVAL